MTRLLSWLFPLALLPSAGPVAAQSLLERPPNVSGEWIAPYGTVQFNFLHRFVRSDAPLRKVTNFPTFVIGVGLPEHTQVGFLYSTNSTLSPGYPNEWEFYGRWLPVAQERGAPVDLGGQLGYNLAAKGFDGEVSIARAQGPVRLIGVTRVLDDPSSGGNPDVALGGGLVLRLQRYIALAGDLVTLTHRDVALGEKPAWSAGVHVAIPGTPHTLSLQATNTTTATLEGASRGTTQRRYGFEFTIPFTLARYFGRRQPPPPTTPAAAKPPAPGDTSTAARTGPTVKASLKNIAFQPSRIEITAGTTVAWTNNDALEHTVTAVDRSFDSGTMAPGATWQYTFTKPGTYPLFCVVHPFMKGVVIVTGVK
ncbi:MAG TPA: cupredoxin family copper-binding protein [Gemmatimonadales bacterium]|nr:cupredoxin family copper-binding protein [Gemmatimonadales bacterium]